MAVGDERVTLEATPIVSLRRAVGAATAIVARRRRV